MIDGRVRSIRSQVSRVSRKRHHFQSVTQLSGLVGAFAAGLSERYRIFAVSVVNIICKLVKVRDVQSINTGRLLLYFRNFFTRKFINAHDIEF